MVPHIRVGYEIEDKGTTPGFFRQVHGVALVRVDGPEAAQALQSQPPEADGGYTLSTAPLHVFTADCIPLLFFATAPKGPVAAVHAGWRGVQQNIVGETRKVLRGWDLQVWIGPHIGPCCFQVKNDFVEAFLAQKKDIRPFIEERNQNLYCDLLGFLKTDQLEGLPLFESEVGCTHCSSPPLPSFRRDGHTRVQIRSWIQKTTES